MKSQNKLLQDVIIQILQQQRYKKEENKKGSEEKEEELRHPIVSQAQALLRDMREHGLSANKAASGRLRVLCWWLVEEAQQHRCISLRSLDQVVHLLFIFFQCQGICLVFVASGKSVGSWMTTGHDHWAAQRPHPRARLWGCLAYRRPWGWDREGYNVGGGESSHIRSLVGSLLVILEWFVGDFGRCFLDGLHRVYGLHRVWWIVGWVCKVYMLLGWLSNRRSSLPVFAECVFRMLMGHLCFGFGWFLDISHSQTITENPSKESSPPSPLAPSLVAAPRIGCKARTLELPTQPVRFCSRGLTWISKGSFGRWCWDVEAFA